MAKTVIMPRFGMTQEESTIVRWVVKEGERVDQGDVLCEVTTDKVEMDVEAPVSGTLAGVRYQEGDTVPVTEVIAYILEEGENPDSLPSDAGTKQPQAQDQPPERAQGPATMEAFGAPAEALPAGEPARAEPSELEQAPEAGMFATPLAKKRAMAEGLSLADLQGTGPRGRITSGDIDQALASRQQPAAPPAAPTPAPVASGKVPASPAARHQAREKGIPIEQVPGTGPQGRIQGWDVAAYEQQQKQVFQPAAPPAAQPAPDGIEVIPLEGMRKTIAARMQASYQQAPHIFVDLEVEMDRAVSLLNALNPRQPDGRKPISLTALLVKAVALALRDEPLLNSHLINDAIHRFEAVNIGVAVAIEKGLIVPVVPNAGQLGLNALGDAVADLSQRARDGQLRPDDVAGGTFTISNLGMFGVDHFTAIINPPQVGILAVGRVARKFVPDENDQPVVRSLMNISLSADHRVVDGVVAARFLSRLKGYLESPNLLFD